MAQKDDYELELTHYYPSHIHFIHFVTSRKWDYCYLICFFLFFLLCVLMFDGFLDTIIQLDFAVLFVPLVGMFFCQVIPTIGSIVAVSRMNDLTKLMSRSRFGFWVSALLNIACVGGNVNVYMY